MHHAIVRRTIAGGVRTDSIDRLTQIREVRVQMMTIQPRCRRARIDIGDEVALLDKMLENPVTGLASPSSNKNAFFRHGIIRVKERNSLAKPHLGPLNPSQ